MRYSRPDYATGVGLAAPLETLRDVKLAIRNGAVALAGDGALETEPSDIALLGPSIASLPALFELARDHTRRVALARHMVMGPNLLCVVGAFSFGWTGLAAVFISNFGTSMAYGRAMRSLRATRDPFAKLPDAGWPEDDEITPAWPTSRRRGGFETGKALC